MKYNPALNVNLITTPLLCVTLSVAALSFFRAYINSPSPFMEYISRASYTIYVIHLPVCLWVSYLLIPYNIALFIKLLVSVLAGLVVSIVVYELLKLAYAAIKFLHPTYSDK
jgi:glucan biosynthesis protein C